MRSETDMIIFIFLMQECHYVYKNIKKEASTMIRNTLFIYFNGNDASTYILDSVYKYYEPAMKVYDP